MKRENIAAKAQVFCLSIAVLAIVPSALASTKQGADTLTPDALLERPAMSLSASELQRVAMSQPAPDGEGWAVVARQVRYIFDAQGRSTTSWHTVERVLTATGARSFGPLGAEWSPWHEERPRIRARVISRDGKVHLIDERTMSEQPASSDDPDIHSDRRTLRVPLPALQPGAVVEYEIVVAESRPLFEKGSVHREYFTSRSTTGLLRLTLEAPRTLPLRYEVHGIAAPQRLQTGTSTRWVFERRNLPRKDTESASADAATSPPRVVFSTGQSWAQMAQAYGAAVEARLSEGSLTALAQQVAGSASSRRSMLQRLLRYLHSEVRYTGVELGEAALLPRSPAETLRRKFGDCKDQSTLLVALLRGLGVSAQVALLRAGTGTDVERNLPGMGLFNHVIVYVPASSEKGPRGGAALWIDPTLEYGQPGVLSFESQRRLALIAGAHTTGLVTTPAHSGSENRVLETREVHLSEHGPARIIETTEAFGGAERAWRQEVKQLVDERRLEKRFSKYAEKAFLAQGGTRVQVSAPEDLETPFRLNIEMPQATRGYSALADAVVAIPIGDLVERLPDDLLESSDGIQEAAATIRPGTQPYRFEPLVHEWRYRIIPPPGFRAAPLPPSETLPLGPGRLHKTFAMEAGGVVTAQLRFDSGSGLLAPAEAQAMRRAISTLREDPMLEIRFEHIGEAHLAAGRYKQAFSEFRRLVNLHPKEALHLAQLALALAKSGLGESARQLAAEAVALEPQSAVAQRLRGSVLMYDLSGTFVSSGWDRAGAIAALRRALSIDPSDEVARHFLAISLEHTAAAMPYGPGSDLGAAVTEWRALVKQEGSLTYHEGLFAALLHARRNAELGAVAEAIPQGELRDAARVITAAVTRNAEAGVAAAQSQIAGRADQRAALTKAAETFVGLRSYLLAAALLEEAAIGAANAKALGARAALLRRLHRHEESAALKNPGDLMRQFFARMGLDDAPGAPQLRALFSPQMASSLASESFVKLRHYLRAADRDEYPSLDYRADVLATLVDSTVQGSDSLGFRIESKAKGGIGFTLFAAREGGRLRIIGQTGFLQSLGYEALRRVDRGELREAQQLLEWAHPFMMDDELASPLDFQPFGLLFAPGAPRAASELRIAAAALACSLRNETACTDPIRSRALSLLTEARDRSSGALRYELALASLFDRVGRYSDVLSTVAKLRMRGLSSPASEALEVVALHKTGRTDLARLRLDSLLRSQPQSQVYWKLLAEISQEAGDFSSAESCWRKLKTLGFSESVVLANLSWLSVLSGRTNAEAEEWARRAAKLIDEKEVFQLQILAAVLLENGKPAEAHKTLLRIAALREAERPPEDSYLIGRLAEHYGEGAAALAAYRQASSKDGAEAPIGSLRWLAQKRLTALTKLAARP